MKTIYTYKIPESLRAGAENMPSKVGIKLLTSEQEIAASKAGNYNLMKSQYEAVKRAICELDGKTVDLADATVDRFWDNCGPKIRKLLMEQYNRISTTTEEEDESFLSSEEIRVA